VEGFGGFLSRRFREHDYQLGRRNCQWFLRQYFAIPTDHTPRNRILEAWSPEALVKHGVKKAGRGGLRDGKDVSLPLARIIPLYGTALPDVPPPAWPRLTEDELEALRPKVKRRLGGVVHSLVNHNVQGFLWGPLARGALKSAWWFQRSSAVDSVISAVRKDLSMRGLMAGR
jgi:hypothetical protein